LKISIDQQIEEIERELDERSRVYPRLIAKGTLRKSVAEYHVERMKATLATLMWLRDNELLIKQRLGA
jgi:hypothetical protein